MPAAFVRDETIDSVWKSLTQSVYSFKQKDLIIQIESGDPVRIQGKVEHHLQEGM
jgi:hypothetical protein